MATIITVGRPSHRAHIELWKTGYSDDEPWSYGLFLNAGHQADVRISRQDMINLRDLLNQFIGPEDDPVQE